MFKYALAAALCFVVVVARPQEQPEVTITRQVQENEGNGNFNWAVETSDGSKSEQRGYIKNPEEPEPDNRIQVIEGSYSYLGEDGTPITVTYVADENGYQPKGDHLPTPPPVPEYVQKLVALLEKNAQDQRNRRDALKNY